MSNPTSVLSAPDTSPDPVIDAAEATAQTDRPIHLALTCQLLSHAWQTTTPDADPPAFLPDVAATLLAEHGPLPAAATVAEAHRHLAATMAATHAVAGAAQQEADRDEQRLVDFHTDVRRRAAEAYNAQEICLDGTNRVLQSLGVAPLQLQYDVDLLVPVTVQVYAANSEDACSRAERQLRDELSAGGHPDFDLVDIRCEDTRADDEYIDPDDID